MKSSPAHAAQLDFSTTLIAVPQTALDGTFDATPGETSSAPLRSTSDENSAGIPRVLSRGLSLLVTGALVAVCLVFGTATSAYAESGRWEGGDGEWWYAYDDGGYATGWQRIDGEWYWFDPWGWMATGWLDLDGTWYYLEPSGAMAEGWASVNGSWYYLNPGSGAMAEGWKQVGDSWYYLQPGSGAMATGWYKVNGEWNWSDSSGTWHPNSWEKNASGWWYAWADGTYPTSSWQLIGGNWYHFDGSGYMQTGWLDLSGTWYYLTSSGAMAEGWAQVNGAWYYLNPGSGAMAEGWKLVNGTWYYLNPSSGAMETGWQWIGGEWYYLESSGAMAESRWVGDYYVGPSGAMLRSQWVDDYYVGADGKWIPSYTDPVKPADPTKPGAAQQPTAKEHFRYAVGDYVTGLGNSTADVKSGNPSDSASGGTYETLPGGGFAIVASGGFDLTKGYNCGHGVYIVGCTVNAGESVVIPDTIDGEPVVYANLCAPGEMAADPRLVLSQVDATQAKHLRWLTVGGAPKALYCQGATELRYLNSQENALLESFDGSTLTNLEVLDFGTLPSQFSVAKNALVQFSAAYRATDRTIPYLDLSDAANLQSFVIERRGGNTTQLGPLTANGFSLKGCDALTTVKLPFQNIAEFDPFELPSLTTLVLTNDPLTSQSKERCEMWAQETGGALTLALP